MFKIYKLLFAIVYSKKKTRVVAILEIKVPIFLTLIIILQLNGDETCLLMLLDIAKLTKLQYLFTYYITDLSFG